MNWRYFLLFLIALSVGSCIEENPKPKELIAEDKYIDLLVELQLVRSYVESTNADSLTVDSLTKEVFNKHDISGDVFRASHTYYQQFPSEQKIRIEKAIERLKMDQVSTNREDTTVQNK